MNVRVILGFCCHCKCDDADDQLVTRGLGACLARGISGVQADELRPVTSALAEEILKQLQTPVSQESTSTDTARKTEHEPTSAAEADASTEETTNSKRPDNESVTEVGCHLATTASCSFSNECVSIAFSFGRKTEAACCLWVTHCCLCAS